MPNQGKAWAIKASKDYVEYDFHADSQVSAKNPICHARPAPLYNEDGMIGSAQWSGGNGNILCDDR